MDRDEKYSRFWWAKNAVEAEMFLDVFSMDDRFWEMVKKYLLNPYTVRGELEYDIQAFCELLEREQKESGKEEKRSQSEDDGGPWEAA